MDLFSLVFSSVSITYESSYCSQKSYTSQDDHSINFPFITSSWVFHRVCGLWWKDYFLFLKNPETKRIPAVTRTIPKRNSFSTTSQRRRKTIPIKRWLFSFAQLKASVRNFSISNPLSDAVWELALLFFSLCLFVLVTSTAVVFLTIVFSV